MAMAASSRRRHATCALALTISLALHSGVGLALVLNSGSGRGGTGTGPVNVDACVLESQDDEGAAFLVLPADPQPLQAVLISPPTLSEPNNVAAAVEPQPAEAEPPRAPNVKAEPDGRDTGTGTTATGTVPALRDNSTSFFHVTAQGQTFVYVIDRSSSMGLNGALAAARQQLIISLEQLPPSARFQIIVYNRTADPLLASKPYLMAACPENIREVARQLADLPAEGGTDHLPALRRALALHPDVIYFLTDADDLTTDHLRAVAQLNSGRQTVIHAIELNTLNRDQPDLPMHRLARDNGGIYQAVDLQAR
jgi:hypothetical protein